MITPETLTPHALETFSRVKDALPPEISSRLKSSRAARYHGNHHDLVLFNVWDRYQARDLFDRQHFSYCLGHNPSRRFGGTTWYFGIEFNVTRIYQYSREITAAFETIFRNQAPAPFRFQPAGDNNIMTAVHREDWEGPLAAFADHFAPLYESLIGAIHPYLTPILDSFLYDLTVEERRAVIASRERQYTGPRKRLSPEEIRAYTRSIPPSWRKSLIEQAGGRCPRCQAPLLPDQIHIDHIRPFSKGGPTTLENLQAICAPCNLAKGNR